MKTNTSIWTFLKLVFLIFGCIIFLNFETGLPDSHNCRFWGAIFTGKLSEQWKTTFRIHLDSLKKLSSINDDGWGIGYYLSPHEGELLTVISRGEPKAMDDPRYDKIVNEMLSYINNGCIVHVRKGSSGPSGGYPNPHPFRRTSISSIRSFDMLFAHNGTINTSLIEDLIDEEYLEQNPPDYTDVNNIPNLDSDLYAIYIMKIIDDFPTYSIDSCIVMATNTLALHLNQNGESALLNFVMTDGSKLWALCYADVSPFYYTLYYFPNTSISDKWLAASQPLDNDSSSWVQIPNYTLVTLAPNESPKLHTIKTVKLTTAITDDFIFKKLYPNPCKGVINLAYYSPDMRNIKISLYDESGRLIESLFDGFSTKGINEITYDSRKLSNGIYFVNLKTKGKNITQKIIFH